jgi:hypothetical protein
LKIQEKPGNPAPIHTPPPEKSAGCASLGHSNAIPLTVGFAGNGGKILARLACGGPT